MISLRETLRSYHIQPRKRLGQSFLEDLQIVRRIASAADPQKEETIVEIGAGPGLLTEELANRAARVIALEIDPRLISILKDRFADRPSVEIVAGDVLKYDFSAVQPGGGVKVVGNIPYHISTPILFHLLRYRRSISSMVLMLQKELADRIMAPPGGKAYGIPSVIVARHVEVTRIMTVPPSCFYPEPEIFSTVLRFVVKEAFSSDSQGEAFNSTVHAAFAQRRKTLRNNLRAAGVDESALDAVFKSSGIDGTRRAETLSIAEFEQLTAALQCLGSAENLLDKRGMI